MTKAIPGTGLYNMFQKIVTPGSYINHSRSSIKHFQEDGKTLYFGASSDVLMDERCLIGAMCFCHYEFHHTLLKLTV